MSESYNPPITFTDDIINLVIEIGELVGQISSTHELSSNPRLRRENRIRAIQSSFVFEQSTFSLEQVSEIIDGKRILGTSDEIRQVKNAYEAYEMIQTFSPYSVNDLLRAHKILLLDLSEGAGTFRNKEADVYAGKNLIYASTTPQYVPNHIKELFEWLKTSKLHPLVKACVFNYEFEFIHPFSDGNGIIRRMWSTLILTSWKEFFAWLPVETLIYERQSDYYRSLNASNTNGETTIFVEFMLTSIRDTLKAIMSDVSQNNDGMNVGIKDGMKEIVNVGINVGIKKNSQEEKLLKILENNPYITAKELALELSISQRQVERIILRMKQNNIIERVGARRNGYWKINKQRGSRQ